MFLALIRRRLRLQLWDAVDKKQKAFEEAMGRVTPLEIKDVIPVMFPQTYVMDPALFPGVSQFPMEEWEKAGSPIMTQAMWIAFAMKIAEKDDRLADIFLLGETWGSRDLLACDFPAGEQQDEPVISCSEKQDAFVSYGAGASAP